ncbi:HVA22-like protein e [Neltuma alba]|uniref:HVA22-like protein e n=1 Tax=Neltuma alba TaxID=207710 RepID=UPI0010A37012|nr:HVA22-like protein e [Prosopis alba]XP_028765473.1 HVA22-like protein e [Prosopis alba]
MGKLWTLVTHLHSLAGPVVTLLYPLYASVVAIESPSKLDDQQWLSYWILYSFLTLTEMLLQSILEWIPIWYDVKLVAVAWLVLPQFNGAAFLYERFVRQQIRRYVTQSHHQHQQASSSSSSIATQKKQKSPTNVKGKKKFVDFILPKKGDHDVY